jgi:1-acyl-sn-glycerol-3-phosphate acyltransferase
LKLRGTVTLVTLGLSLFASDLVQRLVIAPLVHLIPSRRDRVLAWWQQLMANTILVPTRFIGGAKTGDIPQIPARSGDLVLMNHQSLLDIPLVVRSLRPGYPRIVTRERYASGKPLISHMVRLYQYPTVNPRATGRSALEGLAQETAASPVPVVIYPEGTRTRDGSLGRFKRSGLRAILPARDWRVWLVVADGYWECAKLVDFREGVSSIRGSVDFEGPLPGPGAGASADEVEAFIDKLEATMRGLLGELRARQLPSGADP